MFWDYVTQQKPVIDAIQENIPFPFCVSMDTKKKTSEQVHIHPVLGQLIYDQQKMDRIPF
jgi:hypothetical protein